MRTNKSFTELAKRVTQWVPPAGYAAHSARLRGLADYRILVEPVLTDALNNADLTDSGRRKQTTKDLDFVLKGLGREEKDIQAEVSKRAAKRAEIRAARTPQAPDMAAFLRVAAGLLLTQNDPDARAHFVSSMLDVPADGVPSTENAVALAMPAAAFGPAGESRQSLLRERLGLVDLGTEGRQLDAADQLSQVELEEVRKLRAAIAVCGDVDALIEAGVIEKPFSRMSSEERVAYALKHGAGALQELAFTEDPAFREQQDAEGGTTGVVVTSATGETADVLVPQ